MTYARIEDGQIAEYPIYEGDIRLRYPNTSFPQPFEPPAGYELVADVTPPAVDHTQTVEEGTPAYSDGVLTRVWVVANASEEVLAERTAAAADTVRGERNRRLSACDWTQVPDAYNAGIDMGAWAAYRQQLRDVPEQAGFPWQVEWPSEPEAAALAVLCDYRSFYDALLVSPAYAVIRSKAIADSAVLTACVEFIAAIGDAKAGRPNPPAIQACVDLLCAAAAFTTAELGLLAEVMAVGELNQVYTLPA